MKKALVFLTVMTMVGLIGAGGALSASPPKTLNLGTHPVGNLTNVGGTAVAAVVSKHSPLIIKVKAVAGPTTWLPMMGTKEIEFGLFTSADAYPAYLGKGAYEKLSGGKGFPIRLVATGMVLSRHRRSGQFTRSEDLGLEGHEGLWPIRQRPQRPHCPGGGARQWWFDMGRCQDRTGAPSGRSRQSGD